MKAPMPKTPFSRSRCTRYVVRAFAVLVFGLIPSLAHAQGSIYGVVQNSDLSNPDTLDLYWVGFLDNTDEEIRIKTNTGAGYDGTNWFDDFQNYTTEVAGNPYDFLFVNVANGEGFHLEKTIPSNSFQQEDVLLAAATVPARPTGLTTAVPSTSRINVSWNYQSGVTYHVYRRATANNGVFKRLDDPTGSLSNAGVPDSFFVDATSDGATDYTYIIIGEDASGNWSAHSVEVSADAATPTAPTVTSVDPDSGSATGNPLVTVYGTNLDDAGASVTFGGNPATNVTVVSPFELTCNVPDGSPGLVDVVVTNTESGLSSSALTNGFEYLGNAAPELVATADQSVDEGQNLNFGISASDVDGDSIILSAENVPANGTFTDNFDGTGTFDFNPDFTQAGIYNVRFIATDGTASDTDEVQITVNDVNLAPAWSAISDQSVDEGANLNVGVSASDPDGDSLILSAENLPANATFVDNFDGTGTFDFNPDFTQAGVYVVDFIVTDGVLADTAQMTITVNDINRVPVWTAVGAQSVDEGANLNVGVDASDPDGDSLILSAENLPANATFTDNFDGTGTLDFNPDFTQAGVYNVRLIASDGALADTELVEITVNDVNRTPTLAAIGSQNVDEGQNLNFVASGSDPDNDSLIFSALNVPTNATFTDNFDGTATFDFNPDFDQAGVYNVTVIVSDGVLADSEAVEITVNDVNQAPVLASIGSQSVTEGTNLNFGVSASDFDLDSIVLSAENVPANATFIDNFDGTGTFDFNPDFTQAGVYNVTFIASDGALADTELVEITVNDAGNQAPVLASIGSKSVTEDQNLNFGISASDEDLDSLILSAENVPVNATFTDNFDGTGTFDFNPDFTQAGVYNVTFIASDGALADTEIVEITVNDAGNQAPVLASIGAQSVSEGNNLNFGVSATDDDLDSLILSAENVPANATFTDNFDGTGTFDFNPDFTQAGVYNVTFIVSDGALADTEIVEITVNDAGNQAPVLASIGAQSVSEGNNLNFSVSATDDDLDSLILSAENIPTNATFTDNFDGTGTFDFTPDFTQAGVYNVTFIASDGALADTEIVEITVNDAGNQAPVLASIGSKSVTEDQNLNFGISASDEDLDSLILSAENVPVNATFTDNFDGTGTFDFNPDFTQAGVYNVTFIASDGALADTEIVEITVNDAGNQAPVLASIGSQSVDENQNLNFGISASDVDLDSLILSAENVPANATFTDNFDGTGTFDFNPDFTQAGIYNVTFIASDGSLADTEIVAITVNDVNRSPSLATIDDQTVDEGQNLNVGVSASDPDLDSLILSAENLPANATFTDNFDGTGTFDFNPDYTQSGVYTVDIIVTDGALADTQSFSITVNHVNLAPELAAIGSKTVTEGQNLNFGVSGSDFDNDSLILSAENVPVRATFTDNFDGTGTFDFNPDFTQAGVYDVTFIVSDGALADTEVVSITVESAGNQPPVLDPIGSKTTVEGEVLSFSVSATDADSTIPSLFASAVPPNATFADSGDGTGGFVFSPTFNQAGTYNVIFYASDGIVADTEIVEITVLEAGNQKPVLDSIGPQTVDEGQTLELNITATDPEGDNIALSARNMPPNATFADSGNGSGVFTFNPDFSQAATYSVRFIASDGALADTQNVEITVNHVNLAPEIADPGPQSVDEGQNLNLLVTASDFDNDSLIMSAENVPFNATFTDNFDGTGTFDFNPSFQQSGLYTVRFISSDGALTDTVLVDITVNHVNLPPILNSIGSQTVDEGQTLNLAISGGDPDEDSVFFTTVDMPANASLTDNGDGTADFVFSPDFTQAGVYDITFIISDGALADSEIVAITVNESGNQAPVLDTVAAQTVAEGQNLTVNLTATDSDQDSLILSAEGLPTNASFTDNFDGTGVLSFDPDFTQAGAYNVTVIASDGALADTEFVDITVTEAGNQRPVVDSVPPQIVDEGTNLNVVVSASDPDLDSLILSADNLPANATFSDNFDGTGTLDFNPDFTQAGVYYVDIIASDGSLADTQAIEITVNDAGNQAPVLNSVAAQVVDEGQNLNVGVSASDADLDSLILTAENVPANATFTDNFDGTGTFDFNPDFTQAGAYSVRIVASDGVLADTVFIDITVNDVNQAPLWSAISDQIVAEGSNLNFGVNASDPDSDSLILSAENLPANATFVDNFDGTGTFDFTPDFTQSGTYNINFIASDGVLADTEVVQIAVNEAGNQAPVLDTVADQTVDEGQNLNIVFTATDPDADSLTLTRTGPLQNSTFTDNGDGTAVFDFNPSFFQAGTETLTVIASDGVLADTEVVAITINNVNQVPVLDPIGNLAVLEAETLSVLITASDADGVIPTISVQGLPSGAVFADSGDGTAGLVFVPGYDQQGIYPMQFIASDGVDADTESVSLTVQDAGNQPPVLDTIGPLVVQEGDTLRYRVTGSDRDGTIPTLSAVDLPPNATFVDSANGAAGFVFPTNFGDGGNAYQVTFIAADSALADSEVVLVSIGDLGNLPPEFDPVADQSVGEGDTLTILVHAVDPEGGSVSLGRLSTIENATFVDSGNGYGVYTYIPTYYQAGVDTARILAIDDGTPTASQTLAIPITTEEVNIAPDQLPIGDRTVLAGDSLKIRVVATDSTAPPGNVITMAALNLPANATYADSGNGIGRFKFKPTFEQIGSYEITFLATDNGSPSLVDQEKITITVQSQNRAPVLAPIGSKKVLEGDTLVFNITATDPDSTIPFFTVDTLPMNATFVDSGNGVGTFTFTPAYFQSGLYSVTFIANDGDKTDDEQVLIQVEEAGNQVPVLQPVGDLSIVEKSTLTVTLSGFDPDATTPALSVDTLIENATFVDSGNGTAVFSITPQYWQDSVYNLVFVADDGEFADSESVTLTIFDIGNQTPFFTDYDSSIVVKENVGNVMFSVTASDSDLTTPALTARPLPAFATFADSGDGTGWFTFSPSTLDSGAYSFYAVVIDAEDAGIADSVPISLYVVDSNLAPTYGAKSWGINSLLQMVPGESATIWLEATDPDGSIPRIELESGLVDNMTFTDTDTGFAYLTFEPTFAQEGATYDVRFLAVDRFDPALTANDNVPFSFRVNVRQVPPILDSIRSKTITEGNTLQFIATASDSNVKAGEPVIRVFDYPENVDIDSTLGGGRLGFTFSPSYIQAGVYNVLFQARDNSGLIDTERVAITVAEVGNQTPQWTSPFPQGLVRVGIPGDTVFSMWGNDIDDSIFTITMVGAPWNATLVQDNDTMATFSYAPDSTQGDSVYNIDFIISDGDLADTVRVNIEAVPFTLGDVNFDGTIDAVDMNYLISHIFFNGPAPLPVPESGDIDGVDGINSVDLNYMISFLFFNADWP